MSSSFAISSVTHQGLKFLPALSLINTKLFFFAFFNGASFTQYSSLCPSPQVFQHLWLALILTSFGHSHCLSWQASLGLTQAGTTLSWAVWVGSLCVRDPGIPFRCPQLWVKGSICAADQGTNLWATWSLLQGSVWTSNVRRWTPALKGPTPLLRGRHTCMTLIRYRWT